MGNAAGIEFKTVDEARAAGKTQEEIDAFLASTEKVGCAVYEEEFDEWLAILFRILIGGILCVVRMYARWC